MAEVAFHDSPDDAEWIIYNIEEIGTALAKGILKYFNIPYIADNSNLNAEINLLHKVGIIQSPEYWKENAVKGKTIKGENAAILIQRVAAFIMKEAK
ncbi:MAG TPA: hypothetical protein VIO64_04370 [Pseudobacteroides sp.]|uniref:hypothetical protein n=1 Tax=Pseudobacteroides sp. TaxID=1968840 RepID=UPI002F92BD32